MTSSINSDLSQAFEERVKITKINVKNKQRTIINFDQLTSTLVIRPRSVRKSFDKV